MADNKWPKRRTDAAAKKTTLYCVVCRRPVEAGQRYHFISYKGRRYVHASCYEREVHPE